jgi:hypothetical protein
MPHCTLPRLSFFYPPMEAEAMLAAPIDGINGMKRKYAE